MHEVLVSFASLPVTAQAALALLVAVQVSLQVYSLFDLTRRDRTSGLPKWAWALVILLGELLGPAIYLIVGRRGSADAAA